MTSSEPTGWRKSGRSSTGNACVEVARVPGGAAVRDTKNRSLGHFTTSTDQWKDFITAIKTDRFA